VTESSNLGAKPPAPKTAAPKTAAPNAAAPKAAAPKAAIRAAAPAKPKAARTPAHRHPNLGLAPIGMTSGFASAAQKVRGGAASIAAGALEAAVKADPTIETRYDEVGLRRLLSDGGLLAERLAMCLGSSNDRWLTEYAEWIVPIYRRRGVPLADLGALCSGIAETVEPLLGADELAAAKRSLEAARVIFKRDGRLAGDSHKRNALWKWMYRGV
jgi:hypothetical protein